MFHPVVPNNILIHWYDHQKLEDIPEEVFAKIRAGFIAQKTDTPLVSINIIAWNEEANILRNLSSLSAMKSSYPVEFIFVDNNSGDKTSEVIRRCGITPVSETKQGYGFARQTAMEHSRGKYILTGDADTIYPPTWVDCMVNPILAGKGIASFGTYSFIPGSGKIRIRYAFYEIFRNLVHALRNIKHPELVVVGMNFCFPAEEAMKIGFIKSNSRMEDGQMALALLKKGKLIRVTEINSRAWTGTRTVEKSGSFYNIISSRILKESKRISIYFQAKK
ncbi:MAG: glycosyltransferase family 2 protein [Bacteroidetes bacterium]|nr:glycosyltransferase family 2 protein [Bacteroidota bacterium]